VADEFRVIDEAQNVRFGPLIHCKMLPSGALVPMRRWTERLARDLWDALALYPQPKYTVTHISQEHGTITIASHGRAGKMQAWRNAHRR
jgi:hypothetical protein